MEARRDVVICVSGLLLLGVNYALVFWGAQFVPSGLVAILLSGTPVLATPSMRRSTDRHTAGW